MKKNVLISVGVVLIFILITGCIKGKSKENLKKEIPKVRNALNFKKESQEEAKKESEVDKIADLYKKLGLENKLQYKIFRMAMKGLELLNPPQKKYLAIVDFTKDSTQKRFFMIDLKNETLVYNDLVAHGANSGEKTAKSFSNKENSHESSLGFYTTAETYFGSNGYSLKLDGLDQGLNDNARERAIVIHGASYVSEKYIEITGRIGRSWGCPALNLDIYSDVIKKLLS